MELPCLESIHSPIFSEGRWSDCENVSFQTFVEHPPINLKKPFKIRYLSEHLSPALAGIWGRSSPKAICMIHVQGARELGLVESYLVPHLKKWLLLAWCVSELGPLYFALSRPKLRSACFHGFHWESFCRTAQHVFTFENGPELSHDCQFDHHHSQIWGSCPWQTQ